MGKLDSAPISQSRLMTGLSVTGLNLSPNAPAKRDILGTLLLAILAGHQRYAHITALRGAALRLSSFASAASGSGCS